MNRYFILAQAEEEEVEQIEDIVFPQPNSKAIEEPIPDWTRQDIMGLDGLNPAWKNFASSGKELEGKLITMGFKYPEDVMLIKDENVIYNIFQYLPIFNTTLNNYVGSYSSSRTAPISSNAYAWVPKAGQEAENILSSVFQQIKNGEDIKEILSPYIFEQTNDASVISPKTIEYLSNQNYSSMELMDKLMDIIYRGNQSFYNKLKKYWNNDIISLETKKTALMSFLNTINNSKILLDFDIDTLMETFAKTCHVLPNDNQEYNEKNYYMLEQIYPEYRYIFQMPDFIKGRQFVLSFGHKTITYDILRQMDIASFINTLQNIGKAIEVFTIQNTKKPKVQWNMSEDTLLKKALEENPQQTLNILNLKNIPAEIKTKIIEDPNIINKNNEIDFDQLEANIINSFMPGRDPKKIAQSLQLDKTQDDYFDKLSIFIQDPRLITVSPNVIKNIIKLKWNFSNIENLMSLYNLALIFPRGDELIKYLLSENAFTDNNPEYYNKSDLEEKIHKIGTSIPYLQNPKDYQGINKFLLESRSVIPPDNARMILMLWEKIPLEIKQNYKNNKISLIDLYNFAIDLKLKILEINPQELEKTREILGDEIYYQAIPEFMKFSEDENDIDGYIQTFTASLEIPLPDWTKITPIKLGSFIGRFLPRKDARGMFLGHYTECCQHPDGEAAFAAFHGQTDPNGVFFVIERIKNQEIIAQSWVWSDEHNNVVFDNIEGYVKNEDLQPIIFKIYELAAQEIKQITNGPILVGIGYGIYNKEWGKFKGNFSPPEKITNMNNFIWEKIKEVTEDTNDNFGNYDEDDEYDEYDEYDEEYDYSYSDTEEGIRIIAMKEIELLKISQKLENKKLFKFADKLDKIVFEIGDKGLKNSWQQKFPKNTKCKHCGANARIAFTLQENSPEIAKLHNYNRGNKKLWLHDAGAFAIYLCEKCLEASALYNQG